MTVEKTVESTECRKEKIRQRYRGVCASEIDVIASVPKERFCGEAKEKRVAVYVRVSTGDPSQTSSYELQKNHYQDVVNRRSDMRLKEIYADEGISGTSLRRRDAFLRMMQDCRDGKIDIIVTKSVSRFSRNILDCIGYVRQLAALNPPVGVFFETENVFTLKEGSEMSLSFIATLAQEESHNRSEVMNASIEMRFRRGIFLTPPLLGYDRDKDGNLIVNEEESKTVRLIFFMYLYGYGCVEIARTLTELGRRTKQNHKSWSANAVLQQLQNERHCGDVLARKTWTPNYLDHKSKKNRMDKNQYLQKGHHEAIVSRDDFIAVQRLISNAKYGNKGVFPKMQILTTGVLRGFVVVHPRWAGFRADDYVKAFESVGDWTKGISDTTIQVLAGDFDLRGYEVARGEFFHAVRKVSVTLSADSMKFSAECVRKLESEYVELLVHPKERMLAVRPCGKEKRTCVQWSRQKNGRKYSRTISGSAFLPHLFALFGWDLKCKYRVSGARKQKDKDVLLLFCLCDAKALALGESFLSEKETLYSKDGIKNFGNSYYGQMKKEMDFFPKRLEWNSKSDGMAYSTEPGLNVTDEKELKRGIAEMMQKIRLEEEHG